MKEYRHLPQVPHENSDPLLVARRYSEGDEPDDTSESQKLYAAIEDDYSEDGDKLSGHPKTPQWLTYLCYLALLISICSLVDMTRVRIDARRSSCRNISSLRRPTLYPGLEKLVRNETSPGWPLTSFGYPRTVNSLSIDRPSEAAKDSTHVLINKRVGDS